MTVRVRTVRLRWAKATLAAATSLPMAPCAACGCDVPAIRTADAAALLQCGEEALAALVDSGRVHRIPTVSGNDLICRDSLFLGSRL